MSAEAAPGGAASLFWVQVNLLVDAAGKEAAVDYQGLAGNKGSRIGSEIDCSSDQLFGFAEAAHWSSQQQFLAARCAIEKIRI
jgi:hypothetical protein